MTTEEGPGTEAQTSSPLVCRECWGKQTNWYNPCPHAMQIWQQGYEQGYKNALEGAERAPQYEVTPQHMESMEEIAKLANFLSEYLPHEISRSENAVDIVIRLLRPLVESDRREGQQGVFKCKARSANMGANDPQDCDWPMCGCDPYADKVIEALEESGIHTTPQHGKLDLVSGPHDEGLTFDVDDAPFADRQETPADRQSEHFKPGHGAADSDTPKEKTK